MKITSLEKMEQIVKSNRSLSWDGWTVLNSFPSEKGRTSKNGVRIKGVWNIQNRFEPTMDGWDIPNKFVR